MDNTVVHFEIPADQPERAAQFYRELFGWDHQKMGQAGGVESTTGSCEPSLLTTRDGRSDRG
jgi:predicted enzyme related to lactoylglutathione lyase